MYIRTKDRIYEIESDYLNNKGVRVGYNVVGQEEVVLIENNSIIQSDNIEELCDCFIIKYVESNTFSAYDKEDYSGARYVYTHDKQNTTCILYGVIETETALKYVAIETNEGLKLLCQN